MLEASDDDARVRKNFGDTVEEKILALDAVSGLHGRGRESDHASGPKLFRDTKRDGSAHRVACENGARRIDHAAGGESPDERSGAGFGLLGKEGAGRMAVAGEIGDEDAQALFGEGASHVLHDDVVGGNAVKQDDGA